MLSRFIRIGLCIISLLGACSTTQAQVPERRDQNNQLLNSTPVLSIIDSTAMIRGRFEDDSARYLRGHTLLVKEIIVEEYFPILPYLFFDSASAIIPSRYQLFKSFAQTLLFDEEKLPGTALSVYYNLCNIVGSRLRKHPLMKVGMVGFNSDQPKIGETQSLSVERRDAVYRYLREIWQIPKEQLVLLPPSTLGAFAADRESFRVRADNRCVQLIFGSVIEWQTSRFGQPTGYRGFIPNDSMSWEGRKPVRRSGIQSMAFPETVGFEMSNGIEDTLVVRRVVEIRRNSKIWATLSDIGTTRNRVEYDWKSDQGDEPGESEGEYVAQLAVYDRYGSWHRSNEVKIPVYRLMGEFQQSMAYDRERVVKTLLVPIKLDGDEHLGYINYRILSDIVYPNIRDGSTIRITGHAAPSLLADRNWALSSQWADEARILIHRDVNSENITIKSRGVGQELVLFNVDTPEGRHLNNNVEILICLPNR